MDIRWYRHRFCQNCNPIAQLGGIVLEGLRREGSAFGANGSVDGGADEGFVAAWEMGYLEDPKREKR